MVSINKRIGQRISFGSSSEEGDQTFTSETFNNTQQTEEDNDGEQLINNSSLGITLESNYTFRNVNTISYSIFMLFSSIGMLLATAIIPLECSGKKCFLKPLSIFFYMHSIYSGMILICDQLIQLEHIRARRRGYLDFYNSTRTISQLPFWIVSTWSSLLLIISTILHDHCQKERPCGSTIRLNKEEYIIILIGLEIIAIVSVLTRYIYIVWHFNRKRSLPDVLISDDDTTNNALDFGPRSLGPLSEEVFERQADLINYYREHNTMLKQRLQEVISSTRPT